MATQSPSTEKSFRLNVSQVFLTYSQVNKRMDQQWLLKQINRITGNCVSEYLISLEKHKDGGLHLHAYIKFSKRIDTKKQSYFDVVSYRHNYHPNIQKIKDFSRNTPYEIGTKQVKLKSGEVVDKPIYERFHYSSKFKLFQYIKKDGAYITNMKSTKPPLFELLDSHTDEDAFDRDLMYMFKMDLSKYGAYDTYRRISKRHFEKLRSLAYAQAVQDQIDQEYHAHNNRSGAGRPLAYYEFRQLKKSGELGETMTYRDWMKNQAKSDAGSIERKNKLLKSAHGKYEALEALYL